MNIIPTFKSTLTLYAKNFIPLLPITLLVTIAEHFFNDIIKQEPEHALNDAEFLHNLSVLGGSFVAYILIYTLLFSIAIYGMHLSQSSQSFNYKQAIEKGAQRTLPLLLAMLCIVVPLVAILVPTIMIDPQSKAGIFFFLFIPVYIFIFIAFVYLYASSALIVTREYGPINGLKQSWKLTKGYWWNTFVLIFILGIVTATLTWGIRIFAGNFTDEIITFITFPLAPAFMLVLLDNLEKAYQSKPVTPVVPPNQEVK